VINQGVWATAWAGYPELLAGHWKTYQKQPVLAVDFASVINKHSRWIELQLKPVDLYREKELRHSVAMTP